MLTLLVINFLGIALVVWCWGKPIVKSISEDVIILEIACAVFNILLGLISLFDFMETYPTELVKNLFANATTFIWLLIWAGFSFIHGVLALLLFKRKVARALKN